MSFNTAFLNLIDIGLNTAATEKKITGRSIYFQDMNSIEDYPKEPLHERTASVERMISELFYRNPQYKLINIETLNDWEKYTIGTLFLEVRVLGIKKYFMVLFKSFTL
ncbi:hypothetical protein ACG94V_20145 [Acinetobacter sp. ULE_I001]|uniref:hypothetical protein n=1 Tax=unclassified Acinetobacter TaxID=196816 RepID=UPI003AF5AD62